MVILLIFFSSSSFHQLYAQSMKMLAELIMALPLSSFLEPTHEDVMKLFPCPNTRRYFPWITIVGHLQQGFTLSLPELLIHKFSCLQQMKRVYKFVVMPWRPLCVDFASCHCVFSLPSRYSRLPPTGIHIRLTGVSKLAIGVNASLNSCIFLEWSSCR